MTNILISQNISEDIRAALRLHGFSPIMLPPHPNLAKPVRTHADMLVFKHENVLLTTQKYFEVAKNIFEQSEQKGYKTIISNIELSAKYPNDIALNALSINETVYALKNSLAPEICNWYENKILNVSQGYANCSCATVGNAAITADISIASALKKNGIDVLLIVPGNIDLPGYDYGFIGGACFEFGDGIYFFGDILSHPDAKTILSFCKKHNRSAVSLSQEKLCDFGSAIIL